MTCASAAGEKIAVSAMSAVRYAAALIDRLVRIVAPWLNLFRRIEARCYMRFDAVAIKRRDTAGGKKKEHEAIRPVSIAN